MAPNKRHPPALAAARPPSVFMYHQRYAFVNNTAVLSWRTDSFLEVNMAPQKISKRSKRSCWHVPQQAAKGQQCRRPCTRAPYEQMAVSTRVTRAPTSVARSTGACAAPPREARLRAGRLRAAAACSDVSWCLFPRRPRAHPHAPMMRPTRAARAHQAPASRAAPREGARAASAVACVRSPEASAGQLLGVANGGAPGAPKAPIRPQIPLCSPRVG